MHRRAEGQEVCIAPPISKTEDHIHDASEPESTHSHCVGKMIWFVLAGQLGINRCDDENIF